ncbi:MAG: EVE domain-containing protein [Fusobacteriaceae bacterium]
MMKEINYWIFQYTTNVYKNVIKDLETGKITRWEVTKHRTNIKIRDIILLYIGGAGAKYIYGLAEVASEPDFIEDGRVFSNIKIFKRFEKKLGFREIKKEIPKLKIGISGTNFSCSKEEYIKIKTLLEN